MPTAARKQREAEKRRQAEQDAADWAAFDWQLAQRSPAQLKMLRGDFDGSKELVIEFPADMRLKKGLIIFDVNGDVLHHENLGHGGNMRRKNDALDDARDWKRKFPDIWGKRGYAKVIAYKSGLSVETIRRYFKRLP